MIACLQQKCRSTGKCQADTPQACCGANHPSTPVETNQPWAWVDDIAEQARDLMLALMGVAAAGVVGFIAGYGFFLMVRP